MAQAAIANVPDVEPDAGPAYGQPMTIEAWEELDDPGELVDGRLEEEEVADYPHEIVLAALLRALLLWLSPTRGVVMASEAKYALTKRRGRKPDISVFLSRDRKLPRRGAMRSPPDIMVEVVSPRPRDHRRDHVQKLREYAAFGVRWYWLVDPVSRRIEILRLGDDRRYVHALDAIEGVIEVPGCEGLTIDLDAIWRELDELIEPEDAPEEA